MSRVVLKQETSQKPSPKRR